MIRFFLPPHYHQAPSDNPYRHHFNTNGMTRDICAEVLERAIPLKKHVGNSPRISWERVLKQNKDGFFILCNDDQFGRFIAFRHLIGRCVNGIRDLDPEVLDRDEAYIDIQLQVNDALVQENLSTITLKQARAVAEKLGILPDPGKKSPTIDPKLEGFRVVNVTKW